MPLAWDAVSGRAVADRRMQVGVSDAAPPASSLASVAPSSRGGRFYSPEADADANAGSARWVRHEGSWVWRESQPSTHGLPADAAFDSFEGGALEHASPRAGSGSARGDGSSSASPSTPSPTSALRTDELLLSALRGLADDDLCTSDDAALKCLLEAVDAVRARVLAAASSAASRRVAATAMSCCVCYIAPKAEMLVPCGHVSMCGDCADKVVGRASALTGRPCPLCRVRPTQRLHVFL